MNILIAPSILASDFARLGEEVDNVREGGADWLHVDVLDGTFVPNIGLGITEISCLRKYTDMFLDVHLMIDRPVRYVERFAKAGSDLITIHLEADTRDNVTDALKKIKNCGKKVGLAIKPATKAEEIFDLIPILDMVLIMTVEPGFGGQSFMYEQTEKIKVLAEFISEHNPQCRLEVDGGIDEKTAPFAKNAGANVLVAGSAVFGKSDRKAAISNIRNS